MNRRYRTEEFEEIVSRIRNAFEDSILTTDIIVGFPGETENEFLETYEYLKKIKFYKMHIFKYSIREGTKAAIMENQISPDKKEERSNILLKLSDENEKEYLNSYIGKKVTVLFEEKQNEYWKGHTSNYLTVKLKSDEDLSNSLKTVVVRCVDDIELISDIQT